MFYNNYEKQNIMKTTKIKKGKYKIEFNNHIIYAVQYEDKKSWAMYDDFNECEWVDFFKRTKTLKSVKEAVKFMYS